MSNMKFAAFVITYERPIELLNTLKIIKNQEFTPSCILVVDNSESDRTAVEIKKLNDPRIEYYRVGYNSGPAGGAKRGLELLAQRDFDWIYWGDDDDPPRDSTVFSHLFKGIDNLLKANEKVGVFAGKGAYFNKITGRVTSLSNSELSKGAYIETDFAAGGQTLLINAELIRKGILPEEKLFFGFEDLDFCLKVKKQGYKIFTDSESWLKVRKRDGYKAENYRWKGSSFGKIEVLHREFYSTRSLLYIFYHHRFYIAFFLQLLKSTLKLFAGFAHGITYGRKMFKVQGKALVSFFTGKYSMRA